MGHNKLSIFSCGGGSAANCIPPAPRANNGRTAYDDPPGPAPSRAARLDARLAPLTPRRRSAFKSELDNWVKFAKKGLDGEPTENRVEAAERIATAEITQARDLDVAALKIRRLPGRIDKLQPLVRLNASNNELQRLPKEIGDLRLLQSLDVSRNELRELPTTIGRLANLTHLNVSCNKLELLPDEFEELSNLRSLNAHTNQLSRVPASMGKLSQMKEINLHKNRLWALPDAWDALFKRLRQIDLSDNAVQQLPDGFRPGMQSIEIRLQNNPITSLPVSFGGFEYSHWLSDHEIRNASRRVFVHTENTGLRIGLVQEGRLPPGRGIEAAELPLRARERPPAPGEFEADVGSVYSVLDYIREHGQPGQIEGIERVGLADANVGPGLQAPSGPPDWTKPKPATDAWLAEQAQAYANRHGAAPAPQAQQQPPQPIRSDWEIWTHAGLPGSAANNPRTAPPRFNFQLGPQEAQRTIQPATRNTMPQMAYQAPAGVDANLIAQIAAQVLQSQQPMAASTTTPLTPAMRQSVTRKSPLAEPSPFVTGMPVDSGQSSASTPPWGASPLARAGASTEADGARVPPAWIAPKKAAEPPEEESIGEGYQWGSSSYGDVYSQHGYRSYDAQRYPVNPPDYPVDSGNVDGYGARRYDEPPQEEPQDFLTQIEEAMTRFMSM